MNFRSILLSLSVLFLMSCGDDGAPVLNITSPDNGASYSPGSTIPISGTITDDIGIISFRVNSPDFAVDEMETFSDQPTSVSVNFTLNLDQNTELKEYEIILTASDTDGNFDEEKITVKVE